MIYILNENLYKIELLRKYTFSQYENKARDIGSFEIHAQAVQENMYLLDKTRTFFILFDNEIFGKVEDVKYDSDSEYDRTIELSGRLAPYIFTKRVIKGTLTYTGNIPGYIKTLIERNITNSGDAKRYINMSVVFDDEDTLLRDSSTISKQVTGGYLWDEIEEVLEQDRLCLQVLPIVVPETVISGVKTNISGWKVLITKGADRTKGNINGNEAVVFSQSLSNISGTNYQNKNEQYCNVAYVAGEGEAEERKWYEVYVSGSDGGLTGWNRNELWIDARDVQSETDEGEIISETEYQKLIVQRANEKFSDNTIEESYESTIVSRKDYVYGTDYWMGDKVSVIDHELGIFVDAQITSVTVSTEGNETVQDVGFTYGRIEKDPIQKIKQIQRKEEENANSIKYLEATVKKLLTALVQANLYNPE